MCVRLTTHGTKFCDENGVDIIPIRMVVVINNDNNDCAQREEPNAKERFHEEEVSIEDLPSAESADDERWEDMESDNEDTFVVFERELEKVRLILKGREGVDMEIPSDKQKRRFCKSHKKLRKQEGSEKRERKRKEAENVDATHFVPPPNFSRKNEYLYYVGATD